MTSVERKFFTLSASQKPTVGDTKMSVATTDHLGWMLCNGRSLLKSDYLFLFNVIGYTYGGSGTTFNLPSPAGRVLGIAGSGAGLTTRAFGSNVGAETHTLTVAEMPTHTHGVSDPGHNHTGTTDSTSTNSGETNNGVGTLGTANVATQSVNHAHTFTTANAFTGITNSNTGLSNAHNNMQPTLFFGNMFVFSGIYGLGNFPYTANTNIQ